MEQEEKSISTGKGFLAISPMLFFIIFYCIASVIAGNFGKIPLSIAFLLASIYGLCLNRKKPLQEKMQAFGQGAGKPKVLFIIWLFFLAGIFANVAKVTGCFEQTVNLTLNIFPPSYIFVALFVSSCIVSMATGTAFGTVLTLVPMGVALVHAIDANMAMMMAIIVGGSFFGDNLSFVSDTTIVATTTQECAMKDKFRVNLRIVLPAALILVAVYTYLGQDFEGNATDLPVQYIKVIPYAAVIVLAILGMNVLLVLSLGILLAAIIGFSCGSYDFISLLNAMSEGLFSMQEVCVITILASGLMALISDNGGVQFLLDKLTKVIKGKRSAELGIGLLVSVACICTAVNTVAILSIGPVAKEISNKYGLDSRKVASVMDTFACATQGLLPYGAHLLVAASLAKINSIDLLPYLYYPMLVGLSMIIAIIFRLPRKYS